MQDSAGFGNDFGGKNSTRLPSELLQRAHKFGKPEVLHEDRSDSLV